MYFLPCKAALAHFSGPSWPRSPPWPWAAAKSGSSLLAGAGQSGPQTALTTPPPAGTAQSARVEIAPIIGTPENVSRDLQTQLDRKHAAQRPDRGSGPRRQGRIRAARLHRGRTRKDRVQDLLHLGRDRSDGQARAPHHGRRACRRQQRGSVGRCDAAGRFRTSPTRRPRRSAPGTTAMPACLLPLPPP